MNDEKDGNKPLDEAALDKQLAEFDQKVTPAYLLKLHKVKLAKKINAGETGLFEEFRKLKELEDFVASQVIPGAALPASSPQPASPDSAAGEAGVCSNETDEQRQDRILARLHIKPRAYTMSEAAIAQRKAASNSPEKAKSMLGNKNAWKTGEHAQGVVRQLFRPCLSSCPQYPCELIDDGETALGSVCLDKADFVRGLHALQKALRDGNLTDFKELSALRLAGGFDILGRLQEDILENGVKCFDEKIGKDGTVIGYGLKPNPSLLALPKLMEVLGVSTAELMISPREIARNKVEKKKAKALSSLMSGFGLGEAPDEHAPIDTAEAAEE